MTAARLLALKRYCLFALSTLRSPHLTFTTLPRHSSPIPVSQRTQYLSLSSRGRRTSTPDPVANPSSITSAMSTIDQNALKGRKPNKIIPVPPEFRRPSRARERDLIKNEIKVNTDCDVLPQWDKGIIYQFDIFGGGIGLEKAIRYINRWISNTHTKSKDSSAWGKTPAFDANTWYYEQIDSLELERKKIFKGPAPEVAEGETPLLKVSKTNILPYSFVVLTKAGNCTLAS